MARTDGGGGSELSAASCAHVPANEGTGKPVAKHGCGARLPPAPSPSQAHRLAPLASDATRRRAVPEESGRRPHPAQDACVVSTANASASAAERAGPRLRMPGDNAASQATLQMPSREARARWRGGSSGALSGGLSERQRRGCGRDAHARAPRGNAASGCTTGETPACSGTAGRGDFGATGTLAGTRIDARCRGRHGKPVPARHHAVYRPPTDVRCSTRVARPAEQHSC